MTNNAPTLATNTNVLAMAWPMVLLVMSFVAYHIAVKAIRPDLHPLAFLTGVYFVALVLTIGLWIGFPQLGPTGVQVGDLVWVVMLGIALVGIEFGFLMAYRNGWSVAVAPTFSNVSLALVMLPIGVFFLREKLGWQGVAGLAFCVVGLVLMARRPA